ncbi:MAG TPA: hypothetical protein VFD92_26925 [Candidatus Binatia bacterium]|nr:hypothetical protein [Candidatus Binatia bacterium]
MHHKRRRPKNRRAGCLLCKGWKMNGAGSDWRWAITRHEKAAIIDEHEQREAVAVRYPDPASADPLSLLTGPLGGASILRG